MPFTLCLDVTLVVAAIPAAARTAARLQDELSRLADDPRHWAFRAFEARAQDADLIVHARLLEPIGDLYRADPDAPGDVSAQDVVLELLNRHCSTWRALDVGDRPLRAHTQRVRRRFWTVPLDAPQRTSRTW